MDQERWRKKEMEDDRLRAGVQAAPIIMAMPALPKGRSGAEGSRRIGTE